MMATRYLVASIVAADVIACGGIYAWFDHDVVLRTARAELLQQQERGELPAELPDVDIESLELENRGIDVPPSILRRQQVALLIARLWPLWIPAVLILSFGIAALVGLFTKPAP
jgi:hypothetical protein